MNEKKPRCEKCGHQGQWSMRGYWRHRFNHEDFCDCKEFVNPCLNEKGEKNG